MKKVVLFSTVALGLVFIAPQMSNAAAVSTSEQGSAIVLQDVSYQEIPVSELPEAVVDAVAKAYDGYTVTKAFKGSDGSHKVEASNGDSTVTLYYTETGELIKSE
jgi:hypothetical protein